MTVTCSNCGKEFNKNPSQIKRADNNFCSRSCAATVNNKKYKKGGPKLQGHCAKCNTVIPKRHKYCETCRTHKIIAFETPIKELFVDPPKWKFARIRNHAKHIARKLNQICSHCGYDKHVECCHIKSISKFDPKTYIGIVNGLNNLILLCPNCHWELDNGLLSLN